jgi:chromosome segregation ATPase
MTSKNSSTVDISALTHEDLIDAHEKLACSHRELKTQNEILLQQLHNEKLQKKVFKSSLEDLQGELDSINKIHLQKLIQLEKKSDELKEKNQNLIMEKGLLENKVDDLECTINKLHDDCASLKALLVEKSFKPRISDSFAKSLEIENENLRSTINELKEQLDNVTQKYSENDAKIEDFIDKINCLEDNLESKKLELEERNDTVEHLQEKLHEISSELMLLKNTAIDENSTVN